jgi:ferredoxin
LAGGGAVPADRDGVAMQVQVDPELCEANGRCVLAAPELFELDDDEIQQIAQPGPAADRERVRRAVNACPLNALTLLETTPAESDP